MSEANGPKRLQPRMTRGSFRVQFVLWSAWSVLQLVMLIGKFSRGNHLGSRGLSVGHRVDSGRAFLGFLLYVRHHDGHFWEEEEAERAEWEWRGRAL